MAIRLAPIGVDDVPALAELAARPDVARFGDHRPLAPMSYWARWIGTPDPNDSLVLGARQNGRLAAGARLLLSSHRRRVHRATLELVASNEPEADACIDALLGGMLESADRWLSIVRCELRCPVRHPRIDGLFAQHGFSSEGILRSSLRSIDDDALVDEAVLGRTREGIETPEPLSTTRGTSVRSARATAPVRIRNVGVSDAPTLARTMSEASVVWGTLQLPWQRPERWDERLRQNDSNRIVFLAADVRGELAGAGALHFPSEPRRQHVARLGMHVSTRFQGQGIGRKLLDALLDEADRRAISRVELSVYPDNQRALRLYGSVGFLVEGRCRLSSFRDGTYVDDVLMARLAP